MGGANTGEAGDAARWRGVSHALSQAQRVDELLHLIAALVPEMIACERASVALLSQERPEHFHIFALSGNRALPMNQEYPLAGTATGLCVSRAEATSFPELIGSPWKEHEALLEGGIRSTVCAPLLSAGRVIGTLNVGSARPGAFDAADQRRLMQLALMVAVHLDNLRSIEEMRRQVASSERLRSFGSQLAGLAHELKSPIAASLTELRLLRELGEELGQSLGHPEVTVEDLRGIVDEARAHLDGIERSMSRAASFLGMLAEKSLHLQVSQRRDFWLHEALEEALRFVRPRLCQASVSVRAEGVSASIQLHGDPLKLREAVTHLLTNAAEAMERAGRQGEVRLWTQARADEVALWVEDDGPGVPAALRERIFEPLFTSHAAGTGMGLSIARDIMQGLFGGTLALAPGEGGARFVLTLPLRAQVAPEPPRATWAPFQHGCATVEGEDFDKIYLQSLCGDSAEEDAALLELAQVAQEAIGVELGAVELG